jgi:hypothetical protein
MIFIQGRQPGGGFLSQIGCLIFGGLFLVGLFYFSSWLYQKLWIAAPFLTGIALLINWRVVASTGRNWLSLLQRAPIVAILMGIFGFFMIPFLSLYWLFAAIATRQLQRYSKRFEDQWKQQFGQSQFFNDAERPFTAAGQSRRQERKDDDDDYVEYEEVK